MNASASKPRSASTFKSNNSLLNRKGTFIVCNGLAVEVMPKKNNQLFSQLSSFWLKEVHGLEVTFLDKAPRRVSK
jgi:hypothetical protein